MLKLIIPCYGDRSKYFNKLIESIDQQEFNFDYECIFCEDVVSENYRELLKGLSGNKTFIENKTKKRIYGLKNVCRVLDDLTEESIIGIIDADDYFWGKDCFQNIKNAYDEGYGCVWTKNEWLGLNLNLSGPINESISIYKQPWKSTHFKTFLLSDYKKVPKSNFLNEKGDWFECTYDQALYLPIIHNVLEEGRKTHYINKTHYIYRGNTSPDPEYLSLQRHYEGFIRNRGYLEK